MSVIALPQPPSTVVGAPMSYWRTVAWRLAQDRATLVSGTLLLLIALSAVLAHVTPTASVGAAMT